MRTKLLFALFFASGLAGLSQTAPAPAPQDLPKDPRAILAAAAPLYDFSDPALKPWHLKATYQLYDEKGKPTEQGTFEYWWVSPKVYRSTWTRPGATYTDWHTADGKEAHVSTGERLGYFELQLPANLFSPLPTAASTDPAKTLLVSNELKLAGNSFYCVSGAPLKGYAPQNFRTLPTECFGTTPPALRIAYSFEGVVATTYNNIVELQGKLLARAIQLFAGEHKVLTASVDTVGSLDTSDPALAPSKDAVFSAGAHAMDAHSLGSPVKMRFPLYPPMAKQQRIQGTVLIDVAIGSDGKVEDPRVVFSSSILLTAAATEAASHWVYKPPMLNGNPVEVDTVIATIFTLDP
jgi:TonB family protein